MGKAEPLPGATEASSAAEGRRRLHVLFLHAYYCTAASTAGSRSHDLCRALLAAGHRVTVICQVMDTNRALFSGAQGIVQRVRVEGVDIVGLDVRYSNQFGIPRRILSFFQFMAMAIVQALRIPGVDVVFATSTPPTIAGPALAVKILRRVPFVFELRDIWPDFVEQLQVLPWAPGWFFRTIDAAMRVIYRAADRVTCTTPGMTRIIEGKGIARKKLDTILLGANTAHYAGDFAPHPILEDPRLQGRFVVAFLGSISYGYGLERLLDVAQQLETRNPRVAFLLLGRGNRYRDLADRIGTLSLTNVLLGPAIPYSEVPRVLKFVQIGYESSLPSPASDCALDNKFYDYVSAGLPIVSNYDGDMGHLLRERRCGYVVKDVPEEVDLFDRLQRSPEEVVDRAQNARLLAAELDRGRQAEKFVALLEGLAA